MHANRASGLRRAGVRIGVVGAAVAAVMSAGLTPAYADLGDAGVAELGSVTVTGASPSSSGPIIPCRLGEQASASTPGVSYPGVRFGSGTTTCNQDAAGNADIKVAGNTFELSLFNKAEYGRRLIRVRSFEATCKSTENGTSAGWKLGGYSGFTLPSPVPQNHVVTVPGKTGMPPVAKIVVNKVETDQGAIALTAMHITLDPDDGYGAIGGTITVGATACAPTWPPR
ncbi:hypothetical protein M8C13_30235 [Crossiella sp. SN42]|uniref:hypothetical protein n=1 Tax=Crossiella sp. SN42 TaxID=2944808 RepID=UPI00207D37BB|nr:hypothetical protein [Crossiella sp. SN42]MCO1580041.1 hypothetical protein [Crossiella sp. SN42]